MSIRASTSKVDQARAVEEIFSQRTRRPFEVRLELAIAVLGDLAVMVAELYDGHDVKQQIVESGGGVLEGHIPNPLYKQVLLALGRNKARKRKMWTTFMPAPQGAVGPGRFPETLPRVIAGPSATPGLR
jgi:hypothetical protein